MREEKTSTQQQFPNQLAMLSLPKCGSLLKNLLELILYKNVFRFNDKFYIQKQGTAMGTKMEPNFTTTYSPHLPTHCLTRLLLKHCHLEKSPLLSRLFPNRHTVAFRTHKSIRKQLTRARLEDSKIVYKIDRDLTLLCEPLPPLSAPPLIKKCSNNCLTCRTLDTKPYIKSTSKGTYHNLKITNTISSKTRNVIYVITCTRCRVQYTGMTTQPLHNRFSKHLREMFTKRPPNWVQSRLYRHVQQSHHTPSDV